MGTLVSFMGQQVVPPPPPCGGFKLGNGKLENPPNIGVSASDRVTSTKKLPLLAHLVRNVEMANPPSAALSKHEIHADSLRVATMADTLSTMACKLVSFL